MKHALVAFCAFMSSVAFAGEIHLTTIQDFASNACPSTPLVFITDHGRRGLFYDEQTGRTSNGGTTVHCGSGRLFKRVYNGPVDARWFGLEETNTGDQNSEAIANAITSVRGGEELQIPAGRYQFARAIDLPVGKQIRLVALGTLIFPDSDGVIVRSSRTLLDIFKIEGGNGNNVPENGSSGILVKDAHHNEIRLGALNGFNYGIKLDGKAQYNKINFSRLDVTVGIKLSTPSQDDWVNENTFVGGAIYGNVGIEAKRPSGPSYPSFNGNKFYNIGFENVEVAMDVANFQRNVIIAPRFEKKNKTNMNFSTDSRMNTMLVGGMYEHHFQSNGVQGAAGPMTTVLGTMMTTSGDQSGAVGMADSAGKFLGVVNKSGTSAPTTTVISILPLSNVPAVIPTP